MPLIIGGIALAAGAVDNCSTIRGMVTGAILGLALVFAGVEITRRTP